MNIKDYADFSEYVGSVLPEITQIAEIVQVRVGEGEYAKHLEELFDISGPASRMLEEAHEWHYEQVLKKLETFNKDGNPKTKLDAAKKTPCDELIFLEKMESLNETIRLKTSQAQSIIKAYLK